MMITRLIPQIRVCGHVGPRSLGSGFMYKGTILDLNTIELPSLRSCSLHQLLILLLLHF